MPTTRKPTRIQKQVRFSYTDTFHSPSTPYFPGSITPHEFPTSTLFAYKDTFHSPVSPALTFAPPIPSSPGPITPQKFPKSTLLTLKQVNREGEVKTSAWKSLPRRAWKLITHALTFASSIPSIPSSPAPPQTSHENTFYSPVTPALTFASSIQSSPAPPQTSHDLKGPSPSTNSYVPQLLVKPLRLHRLLESAAINWDLMENPSTITRNNYPLSSRLLAELAIIPPLPAFSITSIHLPWTINIRASNGSCVTLDDLFETVYRSLRTNITTNEFNLLPHQNDQKRATRAYEQRYRRFRSISAHDDSEKRGGMKRVDFLMGRTRFHSITNTGRHSDELQLNVF